MLILAQLHTFRVCDFLATVDGYDYLIVVYDDTNCIAPGARGMIIQCPILSPTIFVLIVDSLPQVSQYLRTPCLYFCIVLVPQPLFLMPVEGKKFPCQYLPLVTPKWSYGTSTSLIGTECLAFVLAHANCTPFFSPKHLDFVPEKNSFFCHLEDTVCQTLPKNAFFISFAHFLLFLGGSNNHSFVQNQRVYRSFSPKKNFVG